MNTHHLLNPRYQNLQDVAQEFATDYQTNSPFPNIVFTDFFKPDLLDTVLAEFPDLSQKEGHRYDDSVQRKLAGKGEAFFGPVTEKLHAFS